MIIAQLLFFTSVHAAEHCSYSQLAGKTKEWLAKTKIESSDKSSKENAAAKLEASRHYFLFVEAQKLCAYGTPSDDCAADACKMNMPPKFQFLCLYLKNSDLKKRCFNEASRAQASYDKTAGHTPELGFQGGEKFSKEMNDMADDLVKASETLQVGEPDSPEPTQIGR